MHSLMFACIYLSQNNMENLCALLEKLKVNMLPGDIPGVRYRNDTATLTYIQYIAAYLHQELVEKLKSSPVVGMRS